MISDDVILSEALRLVGEGVSVTFPVNGRSMLPFIVGGRESVILEKPSELRRWDVVLAAVKDPVAGRCSAGPFADEAGLATGEKRAGGMGAGGVRYVVHRIVALDGDRLTLMGDGNLMLREHCRLGDVGAKAVFVVDANGKRRSLVSSCSRFWARVWYILLPLRRYFLWIYRRVK